ncbi:5-formyltetrahydrofolate cyclo-ligase [Gramella sp. AN32]|uniref:5-formyltetrahydrofolate cyclo-ligase n=1 Tax=Christiangramia antarctica TaxID=2058158 RepID=A0ABW5WYP3_9FLAO|nr:5-formyltetrahydrofolate cyclo-ligase [Gramella sp. AN32]MCM4155121.1 5-formyltetrahydrofolate cyclo-ligase [Gramella sp. AN32]
MLKSEIRKRYKELRRALSPEEIEKKSMMIANLCLQIPIWERSFYHIFLSISEQKEIDTSFILNILQGKDKEVIIPRMNSQDNSLINILLTDNTLIKKNRWNIPEPVDGIEITSEKIEVVFIPLLAFDKTGHRVGYGKGFYDKFLIECSSTVIKVGLSFFEPIDKINNIFAEDVPLDYCVTPQKVYDFNKK